MENAFHVRVDRPTYEWLIEEIDRHGDVQDVDHPDSYADAVASAAHLDGDYRIGVVRDRTNADGHLERSWAYVENGVLPDRFSDGMGEETTKVPQRFHRAVAAIAAKPLLVSYGVIRDLEVTVPVGPINAAQLTQAFADAYVRYTLASGLVNDDVLVSSIGAAHVKVALVEGAARYGERFADAVRDAVEQWSAFVLTARYGPRDGFIRDCVRDGMDESEASRFAAVIPDDRG